MTSHFEIMVCDYFCEEFRERFSQIIVEGNLNFNCNCENTYGSHRKLIMIFESCLTGKSCMCGYDIKNMCFVCSLNFISNQIKKYYLLSKDFCKTFYFYNNIDIHTLSKVLKDLSFDEFRF